MIEIRCPHCKRLLLKAAHVVGEITCRSSECKGRKVNLNIQTQTPYFFRKHLSRTSVEAEIIKPPVEQTKFIEEAKELLEELKTVGHQVKLDTAKLEEDKLSFEKAVQELEAIVNG